MRLEGKIAVVTGGARGIGRAIAQAYVKEGARVVIADFLFEEAKKTAVEIGNDAFAVAVDLSKVSSVNAMARVYIAPTTALSAALKGSDRSIPPPIITTEIPVASTARDDA